MSIKCPHCHEKIDSFWTLTAILPEETRAIVDEAITELHREGLDLTGGKRIALGRVIEALCASYVAGQREHARALEEVRS